MFSVHLKPLVLSSHLVHVTSYQPARMYVPFSADQDEYWRTIAAKEFFIEHETLEFNEVIKTISERERYVLKNMFYV